MFELTDAEDVCELTDAEGAKRRKYLRDHVRWEDDPVCQYVVERHPEGLTIPQVSAVLGLAPSNVSRDQTSATRKLRALATHPELGPLAQAWADQLDGYERTDAQRMLERARTRVLLVLRDGPMTSRQVRARAHVRRAYVFPVLAEAVSVGLVHVVSAKREKRYQLRRGDNIHSLLAK